MELYSTNIHNNTGGSKPKMVSIIIACQNRNELKTQWLVQSIKDSTYKNVEIIIVEEGIERSIKRNMGIKRAKGKYVFIPDSDWVVTPYLIGECVALMDRCDAIYIPETIKTKGLFARIRHWERQFYTATPIDVVRFVKAPIPLFDEEMVGIEDAEWDRRVQGKRLISKNCYYHYDNTNFLNYFRKKVYYSKNFNLFEKQYPKDKIFDPKWRCWTVFVENGKYKRFFGNPLMALCVMFTIVLKAIIYKMR